METRHKALISISISALLIVLVLFLQSIHSAKAKTVNTQTNQTFDKLPPGLAPAVANVVQKNLPESYQIKKSWGTYHADNESHGMRYAFSSNGPTVQSTDRSWQWQMTLQQWGYESKLEPVTKAEPTQRNNRVEYKRGQSLTEWYKNTAFGLEQGFTINSRPNGFKQLNSELTLEIAISGTLTPNLQGKTLLLQNEKGENVTRYTGLYAYDTNHQELPTKLILADNTLNILVDDSIAVYPVTIDPWIQSAKLTVNGGTSMDNFALALAVYGDIVVVGAPTDFTPSSSTGAAYVFEKPGTGWSSTDTYATQLVSTDGYYQANQRFGCSVDIYVNYIIVGANLLDTGAGETNAGAAYVFTKPGSSWSDAGETMTETTKLTAPASDRDENDEFGYSVAIGSDIIVVGAHRDDHETLPDDDWGAAYVFEKAKGHGWDDGSFSTKLVASDRYDDTYKDDHFGCSVDVNTTGSTIVVGAINENLWRGAAYVFTQPVMGWASSGETTTETAKLTKADYLTEIENYFGQSVAISTDTIVVGAPGHDIDCDGSEKADIGAAYVFEKPTSGWVDMTSETAKLTTGICTQYQYVGERVAIDGNAIVVSARGDNSNTGAAYIFEKPESGWTDMTYTSRITARDGAASDQFGKAVGIDSNTVFVGSPNAVGHKGAVYLFEPPTGSLPWMIPLLLQ